MTTKRRGVSELRAIRLIPIGRLAKLLNLSDVTIKAHVKKNPAGTRPVRLGIGQKKRYLFRASDVEAYLTRCQQS